MSEDNADIAVIKTLIQVQADTSKRIEDNLREWRQENREAISALKTDTEREMSHQKRNNAQKFDALERLLHAKADATDLDTKADKIEVQAVTRTANEMRGDLKKGVWIVLAAVFAGIMALVINPAERIKDMQHRTPVPAVATR